MENDPEYGGPTAEQRRSVYETLGLDPQNVREIEAMVVGSGARQVAKAALMNVPVVHVSQKNGSSRTFESHTCELVHAYELELDPEVLGYYAQVPCRRVERTTRQGMRHVSSATIDFLVFRTRSIELVECKLEQWLADHGWAKEGQVWQHPPYADWAKARGLKFLVWTPPVPCGVYQKNLEACYSVLTDQPEMHGRMTLSRVQAHIKQHAATIEDLKAAIPKFTDRTALWMIAKGLAYATIKSTPVQLSDRFKLYSSMDQAKRLDDAMLGMARKRQAQSEVIDPVLNASATDVRRARDRLTRLESMAKGIVPYTRRMRALQRRVDAAEADGTSSLSVCLTNFAKSGNRNRRVLAEHIEAMESVVSLRWNTGKIRRPQDLVYEFEDECRRLGVEPCGRAGLDKLRREQSKIKRALLTGGLRAYQSHRVSTDPRTRSLAPLGYGQVLHIDSSDFDVRTAPDLLSGLPAAKPRFYIGVDGASQMPMSHSLIYGPARSDGLALLLREHVQRHGFLPKMIHLDRGPENRSKWIEEFCYGRISLRYSPTAASQWNGIAEAAIKRANQGAADHMAGSTLPDKHGRAVDGKFKSRRNARTAFTEVCSEFDKVVYGDMPGIPNHEDLTPTEIASELVARFGCFGTPCKWSDDFVIQTSIPVKAKGNSDSRRGIRTEDGWYSSDELFRAMQRAKVEALRSDCADPCILHIKIGGVWLKAYHSKVQSDAALTGRERLYELMEAPTRRACARRRRADVARKAHTRRQFAAASITAIAHLSPPEEAADSTIQECREVCAPREEGAIEAFDEAEDF